MNKTYKLGHELVAYVLLASLFLQSCYNPSIPSIPLPQGKPTNLSLNGRQKQARNFSLLRTSFEQDAYLPSNDLWIVQAEDRPTSIVQEIGVNSSKHLSNSASISPNSNSLHILTNQPANTNKRVQGPNITRQAIQAKASRSFSQALQARQRGNVLEKRFARQESSATYVLATLLANQVCIAQGGYQVKFKKQPGGNLQAIVEHQYFKGIPTQTLPVVIALDLSCSASVVKNSVWQKHYIHVMKDYVYVGSEGLQGGTMEVDEEENIDSASFDDMSDYGGNLDTEDSVWEQLLNIATDQKIKKTVSNSWATGPGIDSTLNELLEDHAHIIHPDLSCIHSPAASDDNNATEGAKNYAKNIKAIIDSHDRELSRPIIMVLNTQPTGPLKQHDMKKKGGLHWQTCVILPKNYTSLSGTRLNNDKEIVFYIDSLDPDKEVPKSLLSILKEGTKAWVETDQGEHMQTINAIFPNVEVKDKLGVKQQSDGSSCGWWAVYNALMIVYTGGTEYLEQFRKPSTEIACKLRTLLPSLDESTVSGTKRDEKAEKNPRQPRRSSQSQCRTDTRHDANIDSRLHASSLTPDGLKHALHGDLYQLGLLTWVAIKAHNNGKSFHLVSEAKECEKFDDLVIDYGDNITFLQAKHSSKDPQKDGYTKADFCRDPEAKENEASLAKYFDSWHRLKKGEYTKKQDGSEKASKFIFFTNRQIKDYKKEDNGENYLEKVKSEQLKTDEFLFEDLQTESLKFKQGISRFEFINAINNHSGELIKNQIDKLISKHFNSPDLVSALAEAAKWLEIKFGKKKEKFEISSKCKLNNKALSIEAITLIGLIKTNQSVQQAIIKKVTVKGFEEWVKSISLKIINPQVHQAFIKLDSQVKTTEADLKPLDKELVETAEYLKSKFQATNSLKNSSIDTSLLAIKVAALINLVKTDDNIKAKILSKINQNDKERFSEWLDKLKITTNLKRPILVLLSDMENEIGEFLDELIIKVEQPGISPLLQLLSNEFKLGTRIGHLELFHAINNRMLEWLSDRKTCLMKSDEFKKLVRVEQGDLHRFYLLGSTKMYEQEFENYPLGLEGLEINELAEFLKPENKRTLAVINDNGSGGVKARIYHTVKKFREKEFIGDAEWAFLSIDSRYSRELPDVLQGKSTQFVVVDCRSRDGLPKECGEILQVAKENGKKLVLLVNPTQKEELSSWLSEKNKDDYKEFNLPALTNKQINQVCKQHAEKDLYIGGKYVSLSSVLKSTDSGLYRQLTNMDSLHLIIESLVESSNKEQVSSSLPYDVYVANDLVQGIPCYGLLYLLQTVNASLFVIEGVEKDKIDNWFKQKLKDKYASGDAHVSEDTRYRLVGNSNTAPVHQEKLIYIANGEEIKHNDNAYVRLTLVNKNKEEYEFKLKAKSKEVNLPAPLRYDFSENKAHGKDMRIKHTGAEFLKEDKPSFSILTAHAGLGKSSFCLNQRSTWRNSKEDGLPSWVVRINLPQVELLEKPSFRDAFTLSSTAEDWPAWKLKALQDDMQTPGRCILIARWIR